MFSLESRQPQPAKGILALRRITNRQVASSLGCSTAWVGRVLNGHVEPPERFRQALSSLLDTPISELFREEAENDEA